MTKNNKIIPVILCGGSGSRLWPLSRESLPKQFWPLIVGSDYSLLQNTYERVRDIPDLSNPLIITNEKYRFLVEEQMKEININDPTIILEPQGRNTAPAIALAALQATSGGENPYLLILSSDHFIQNDKEFKNKILEAIEFNTKDDIITFGIIPTSPETGYGYIEIQNEQFDDKNCLTKVLRFVEKPNNERANQYVNSGKFLWNSGIFLVRAEKIIIELEKYASDILIHCRNSFLNKTIDNNFIRPSEENFIKNENTPIDIAVLEKSNSVKVMLIDIGWSDIGDWNKLWEKSNKDKSFNSIYGNTVLKNCSKSFFYSKERLIVGVGLEDLAVVDADDALLIIDKKSTPLLKEIVNTLKSKGFKESKSFNKEFRPWGSYKSINSGDRWQVKEIIVKPGQKLSLQSHYHRSEHWIVVKGTAIVEIDGTEQLVRENESVYIPLGSKHRLSNPGKINMNLIEVQTGSYLDEEDIIRYDDIYGREKS